MFPSCDFFSGVYACVGLSSEWFGLNSSKPFTPKTLRDIKIEMDLQLVERENIRGILGKNYLDFTGGLVFIVIVSMVYSPTKCSNSAFLLASQESH